MTLYLVTIKQSKEVCITSQSQQSLKLHSGKTNQTSVSEKLQLLDRCSSDNEETGWKTLRAATFFSCHSAPRCLQIKTGCVTRTTQTLSSGENKTMHQFGVAFEERSEWRERKGEGKSTAGLKLWCFIVQGHLLSTRSTVASFSCSVLPSIMISSFLIKAVKECQQQKHIRKNID